MGVIRAFQKHGQIVSRSFIREVRVSGSGNKNLRKGSTTLVTHVLPLCEPCGTCTTLVVPLVVLLVMPCVPLVVLIWYPCCTTHGTLWHYCGRLWYPCGTPCDTSVVIRSVQQTPIVTNQS